MAYFFKTRKSIYKAFFIIGMVFFSSSSFAFVDCNDPLDPDPFGECDPFLEVPIDDGVYFLLAAGVLIGYTLLKPNKSVKVG